MADKYLKVSKNEDINFIGDKMNQNKWSGILVVLAYSLLPLPSTPPFLRRGISKIKPIYIIAPFLVGKFTSDSIALHLGKFASENQQSIIDNIFSWQPIASFVLGFVMLFHLFFVNWRTLVQTKKLAFNFKILN